MMACASKDKIKIVKQKSDIEISKTKKIKPIKYSVEKFDLTVLTLDEKKIYFINLLLPSILIIKKKLSIEEKQIIRIAQKLEFDVKLTKKEKNILEKMMKKYNVKNKDIFDLLVRIKPHPTSVVLAQAIIETGWGTSNFFKNANNVFGMWSYNEKEERLRAKNTRGNTEIYVKKYKSLYESLEDYFFRIATVKFYSKFREKRYKTTNYTELIKELNFYSEIGDEYVKRLKEIIEYNKLYKYDEYELKES